MTKQCIITVRDEVNVKIDGLEARDRRDLHRTHSHEIPGARYLPAVKLGRWDGKVSYFSLTGSTFINLLPEILPTLDERGYDIELVDLRQYSTNFQFTAVDENTFASKTWPTGHPAAGQLITLRDYQVDIINRFLENPQCLQEIATGAGKTIITAALSNRVEPYGRTVVIVPNKSLVTQTELDYRNLGLDVGVYYGERKEAGHRHTIATWQSLNVLLKNTRSGDGDTTIGEFLEGVVCVIVDEVHQAKADALKQLLCGPMSTVPLRWGLTGTIPKDRYASVALTVTLGSVINRLSASELQDRGVLASCHVNVIQTQDSSEFGNYQSELKYLLENRERLDTIGGLIRDIAVSGNTLILVDRVGAGHALLERLPGSVFISGDTKMTERKESYDQVATSNTEVIIATYGVAAVGINLPRIFNLILIEPGKSFVRVIQSIGRGIRRAEDKEHVMIYDITSSCKFSKRHLTERKRYYNEAKYPFDIQRLSYK